MALKDLIVDTGEETEKALEEIISAYVRFEIEPHAIVFTAAGNALGNLEKVIVYCAAVFGWKYVVNEPPRVSTTPADLGDALGIHGSTIRSVLKKLKDNHVLAVADGHYSIHVSNLATAASVLSGEKHLPSSASKSKRVKPDNTKAGVGDTTRDRTRSRRKTGVPISASLDALLSEGFFGEFRTLAEVVERLHELAVNAKMTSLSGRVAALVREKKLERKKANRHGKQVWIYRQCAPR